MASCCLVVGFFARDATYGRTLIALGLALASLGGLDTTAREHFSGFRSHTLVLAAFPAVAAAVLAAVAGAPALVIPPLMALVFAAAIVGLRRMWRRTAKRTHA